MDYDEEQAMEIEALESILMDELQLFDDGIPKGFEGCTKQIYRIPVIPSEEPDDGETNWPLKMELLFAHTATYPEEAPMWRVRSVCGLSDADISAVTSVVEAEVETNIGMAMVFQLVTCAREWLIERAGQDGTVIQAAVELDPEEERKRREAEEEAKMAAARCHGHMVTMENWAEWKAAFEKEMAEKLEEEKRATGADKIEAQRAGRMTGKQFFMQNSNKADAELVHADSIAQFDEEDLDLDDDDLDYDDDDLDDDDLEAMEALAGH